MPKICLVVCLYKERDLLERLLQHAEGCYDDLVVVHDGPEDDTLETDDRKPGVGPKSPSRRREDVFVPSHRWPAMAVDFSLPTEATGAAPLWLEKREPPKAGSTHELVARHGGRFFEGPRCWQQEPHWPFAWSKAQSDWILKLDADEFPSEELGEWLRAFRRSPDSHDQISGYTCIWPMWDGQQSVTKKYPRDRLFLFNRKQARYFGMVEQVPEVEGICLPQELVLCHQPKRKSYGVGNILFRHQAYRWRTVIAETLQRTPLDLPRWRWSENEWPIFWQTMIANPLRFAFRRLLIMPLKAFRNQLRYENRIFPESICGGNIHHFLICTKLFSKKLSARP